jgi:hypothetical protein
MLGRAWIAATLLMADLGLTLVAGVAWQAQADGLVSGGDIASISLFGGCALAGLPVAVTVGLGNIQGVRALRTRQPMTPARRLASAGQWLAATRLLALVVAAVIVAAATSLNVDLIDACGVAIAAFDALLALLIAVRTASNINRPPA